MLGRKETCGWKLKYICYALNISARPGRFKSHFVTCDESGHGHGVYISSIGSLSVVKAFFEVPDSFPIDILNITT